MQTFEASYEFIDRKAFAVGAFSQVWRCRQRNSTCSFRAVKRIDMEKMKKLENVEKEVQLHLELEHPYIVKLHEVIYAESTVSLVMELCEGGDLFDMIATNKARYGTGLTEQVTAHLMRHVLGALAFLHERCVVHRDVKCENVVVLERGMPSHRATYKLCDFGYATTLPDKDSTLCDSVGSPDSVAPEVLLKHRYSTPVDMWGAGVLLYMALSAQPPFGGATDEETIQNVIAGKYSLEGGKWDLTSPGPKALTRSMLTYDSGARCTAEYALRSQWLKDMNGCTPHSETGTSQEEGLPWMSRGLICLIAIGVILNVAGAFIAMLQKNTGIALVNKPSSESGKLSRIAWLFTKVVRRLGAHASPELGGQSGAPTDLRERRSVQKMLWVCMICISVLIILLATWFLREHLSSLLQTSSALPGRSEEENQDTATKMPSTDLKSDAIPDINEVSTDCEETDSNGFQSSPSREEDTDLANESSSSGVEVLVDCSPILEGRDNRRWLLRQDILSGMCTTPRCVELNPRPRGGDCLSGLSASQCVVS